MANSKRKLIRKLTHHGDSLKELNSVLKSNQVAKPYITYTCWRIEEDSSSSSVCPEYKASFGFNTESADDLHILTQQITNGTFYRVPVVKIKEMLIAFKHPNPWIDSETVSPNVSFILVPSSNSVFSAADIKTLIIFDPAHNWFLIPFDRPLYLIRNPCYYTWLTYLFTLHHSRFMSSTKKMISLYTTNKVTELKEELIKKEQHKPNPEDNITDPVEENEFYDYLTLIEAEKD